MAELCDIVDRPGWILMGCEDSLVKAVIEMRTREAPRLVPEAFLIVVVESESSKALVDKARRVVSTLGQSGLAAVLEV